MTKEEIREKHLYANGLSVNKSDVGKKIQKAAFDAMDEFARQEAIEFAEYIYKSARIDKYNGRLKWETEIKEDENFEKGREWHSTEQLYDLYLQSKKP